MALRTERPILAAGQVYGKTILALALLARLGPAWLVLTRYPPDWLFLSHADLALLAQSLNSGRGLSSPFGGSTGPTAFLAPGYPVMAGLIFHLFGSYTLASAAVVIVLQTLFALLTVAAILHIAQRLFGATTANLAGTFWALSPPLLWLPLIFWDTSLSALLLTGTLAIALQCGAKPCFALWALAGTWCGVALLVNPSLMPALLCAFAWSAYRTRSLCRYQPLLGVLLMVVVFVPWPIRNAMVLHAFIPLRSSLGYELWQGNHAGATGQFDPALYPLRNPREHAEYAAEGEVAYMQNKTLAATDYIRAHQLEFLRLTARRVVLFWTAPPEAGFNVLELHAGLTSLLGWLGLVLLFRQRRPIAFLFFLPLLVFPLPYYVTHPDFRFRVILDPLLTILGAFAMAGKTGGHRGDGTRPALAHADDTVVPGSSYENPAPVPSGPLIMVTVSPGCNPGCSP